MNTLKRRKKRQTIELDERGVLYDEARDDVTVKVHTGMYVHEASDLDPSSGFVDDTADEIVSCKITSNKNHIHFIASNCEYGCTWSIKVV